jgi:hypothetical protein
MHRNRNADKPGPACQHRIEAGDGDIHRLNLVALAFEKGGGQSNSGWLVAEFVAGNEQDRRLHV